jgi:hypothetical protein
LTQTGVGSNPTGTGEAATLTALVNVIKNQVNNNNLLTLPSVVYPSLSSADVILVDDLIDTSFAIIRNGETNSHLLYLLPKVLDPNGNQAPQ